MATHTTLSNLFADIADSIRAKKGSTETIVADNFPTEIANLPSGGGDIKIETQTYTPINDETSHDFTHSLGVIPDMIMCYWGQLPNMYGKSGTSLQFAFGVKNGIFNLGNETRYLQNFNCVFSSGDQYATSDISHDITSSEQSGGRAIYNVTSNAFTIMPNRLQNAKLIGGLTYYIIIFSGLN